MDYKDYIEMNYEEYMRETEKKFVNFFALEKNIVIDGIEIDLYADYSNTVGRTLITMVDIIDQYEINEKCYFKHYSNLKEEDIQKFFEFLKVIANNVKPSDYHRSTDITGIIVCDNFDIQHKGNIAKQKYVKYFNYYFKGWAEVRLICIDLKTLKVYTNKAGKTLKKLYIPATASNIS